MYVRSTYTRVYTICVCVYMTVSCKIGAQNCIFTQVGNSSKSSIKLTIEANFFSGYLQFLTWWAESQISPAGVIPENKGNGSQHKCLYKRAWSGGARGSRARRQGRVSCQPGIGGLQGLYRSCLSHWTWRSTRPGWRTVAY